jgi:hypothetical protein
MNILAKPVKKALVKKYGFKNVSVKTGRGTAWGWVDARIIISKSQACQCKEGETYCQECKNTINQVSQEAQEIGYKAVKSEFLVQVSLK